MNNRQQIDSWVASYMCDVVESFTHLEEIIRDLRWRMLRGEPREMQMMMLNARKHARDLVDYADPEERWEGWPCPPRRSARKANDNASNVA
jgi:hypothetical protein